MSSFKFVSYLNCFSLRPSFNKRYKYAKSKHKFTKRPIVFENNIDIHLSLSNQPISTQNKQFNMIMIKSGSGNAFTLTLPDLPDDERLIRIISITGVKKYTRDAD